MYLALTKAQATKVLDVLTQVDDSASVYFDYSGRGMFGLECVGWVTTKPTFVVHALVTALELEKNSLIKDIANEAREDNMGLHRFIVYFPSIQIKG